MPQHLPRPDAERDVDAVLLPRDRADSDRAGGEELAVGRRPVLPVGHEGAPRGDGLGEAHEGDANGSRPELLDDFESRQDK